MPTPVTYNYVAYDASGPHIRQPGRGASTGFTQLLDPFSGGSYTSGDVYPVPHTSLLPTIPLTGTIFKFAFVNVSGGVAPETNNPSTDVTLPPSVTVGTSPILILVVYVPEGTNGGIGTDGATIDAFDESLNTLVNDTFVTVSPNTALTANANVQGFVPTASAETIMALETIVPTAGVLAPQATAVFDKWVDLNNKALPPAGLEFAASANSNPNLLAFYRTPPASPPLTQCQIELNSYNALPDKVGTPVALLEQFLKALSACVGPQYEEAVAEIKRILAGTQTPPTRSPK